ncbi:hypothetical protein HYPSUDRAFT_203898 [Hypholoma sublateritium FD-334 SS-4]|uniref:Uncharacterized protein n=1 Tax=Hypholoma sublateritium (strain FD-334 SS-4) TaxID=945553 RepID=A0A0D2L0N1_HYPSF|nr:hypothetical protein HYPSUDRAFT_203898 [Hypholoma sublateritium FD-334 SS-4]
MRECTEKLIAVVFRQPQEKSSNLSNVIPVSTLVTPIRIDASMTPPVSINKFTPYSVYEAAINPLEKSKQKLEVATTLTAIPVENVTIERKAPKKAYKEQQTSGAITELKKKKRKSPKNEIDDIFGF